MQKMHTHANAWCTRMIIILTMLVVTLPSLGTNIAVEEDCWTETIITSSM